MTSTLGLESCSEARIQILERQIVLESTEAHLLGVLGVPAEVRAEIIKANAETLACDEYIEAIQARIQQLLPQLARHAEVVDECRGESTIADAELVEAVMNSCSQRSREIGRADV